MKAKIFLLLLAFSVTFTTHAQNRGKSFDLEKFKEERAQYFIREIGLTPTEAKIFIPLSNELMAKKFELNKSAHSEMNRIRQKDDMSKNDYIRIVDESLDIKLKEAQLDIEYYQKFKKILPPEKLYKFQKAELKFMRTVIRNANDRTR